MPEFIFFTLSPLKMGKNGYNVLNGMYVTGRRGRGRLQKVYIFLIRINSRVD